VSRTLDPCVLEPYFSAGRALQPRDEPEEGRLAAPGGSHDPDDLPRPDGEADPVEHDERGLPRARELLSHGPQLDESRLHAR